MTLLLGIALAALQDTDRPAPAPAPVPGFPGLAANRAPQVEIPWNRLYPLDDLYAHFDALADQWPEHLSMEVVGFSSEGRELRLYTLNDAASGPAEAKSGMWIDGNVHGNEVQGSEAVLYTAWYLLENAGINPRVDALLERAAFYLLPSINPDGREHWFADAGTASTSRSGQSPLDNDRDGQADEDGPNDLDGDGNITQMRKFTPGEGTHRLNPDDPRRMERVPRDTDGEPGDWTLLGSEGFDDDGDGRINEDGLGGYDMNRSWPSSWQPNHVQFGAGPYPLYWPETRSVAETILARPNIAAVQSFHNSGGMILRGPGSDSYGNYPRADLGVYDALGAQGERMLPFYNYWVIWDDLYTVFGGFVNWTYEGLGIVSFTNEMWTGNRLSPDNRLASGTGGRHQFDDELLMSAGFTDWTTVEHPFYGEIEVGGFAKDVGRVPPSFLVEEELHRNALFCLAHAEAMPQVELELMGTEDLGNGLFAIEVRAKNAGAIPTRTAMSSNKRTGIPDELSLEAQRIVVVASGERRDRWRDTELALDDAEEPGRVVREHGLFEGSDLEWRFLVAGTGEFTIRYRTEKALDVELTANLDG